MVCRECGENIPNGGHVCPVCGHAAQEDYQQSQRGYYDGGVKVYSDTPYRGGKKRWVILALLVMMVSVGGFFCVQAWQKHDLKQTLMKEIWYGKYQNKDVVRSLEFDEDTVEYYLDTGYALASGVIADMEWWAVTPDTIQIKVNDEVTRTIKVSFNEDKMVMTFRPALTTMDSEEKWYDLSKPVTWPY